GDHPREHAIELMSRRTRQYAKRQDTWARRWPGIVPVDATDGDVERIAAAIVSRCGRPTPTPRSRSPPPTICRTSTPSPGGGSGMQLVHPPFAAHPHVPKLLGALDRVERSLDKAIPVIESVEAGAPKQVHYVEKRLRNAGIDLSVASTHAA